jgi:hypothetical protein
MEERLRMIEHKINAIGMIVFMHALVYFFR